MELRIGVVGNCDTGAITASLRQLMLNASVTPLTARGGALWDYLNAVLPDFDLIFLNGMLYKKDSRPAYDSKIVVYPQIIFKPFHPDCCYVWLTSNGALIENYHSALCLGCFVRGLSVERTVAHFNKEIFEHLGYFSIWDSSIKRLTNEFNSNDFDFKKFFLRAKRSGVFMHSINHATKDAFAALSALLAVRAGAPEDVFERPVFFPDALSNFGWPVYPEVGEIFSSPGAYVWLYNGKYLGLHDFVAAQFNYYASKGFTRDGVRFADSNFHVKLDALLGVARSEELK